MSFDRVSGREVNATGCHVGFRSHRGWCPFPSPCDMRLCQFCKRDIGDEFHYLLRCVNFKEERRKHIDAKDYIRPSSIYLQEFFKQVKIENLKQLAVFAKIIICKFKK